MEIAPLKQDVPKNGELNYFWEKKRFNEFNYSRCNRGWVCGNVKALLR